MGAFMRPLTINSQVLSMGGGCWGKEGRVHGEKAGCAANKEGETRPAHRVSAGQDEPAPLFDLSRDGLGGAGRREFGSPGRVREERGRECGQRGIPEGDGAGSRWRRGTVLRADRAF